MKSLIKPTISSIQHIQLTYQPFFKQKMTIYIDGIPLYSHLLKGYSPGFALGSGNGN